jgi:GDP-L-fucose synthase
MPTILVTGKNGLVGNALRKILTPFFSQYDIKCVSRQDYDLRSEKDVVAMYHDIQPNYIINCAAIVGGIKFNKEHPDVLFRDNLLINLHMIHYARHFGIKKLISFSSACAYQDGVYPFQEDKLQDGKPYHGNLAYGYAKRMVDIQTMIYNNVHKREDVTLIPVSLYGPHDNFSLENGHFISSLIRKTHEAKKEKKPLVLWGDGSPLRELLFSEDLARVIALILEHDMNDMSGTPIPDKLLVTSGEEVSIKQVAEAICDIMGFEGGIEWDTSKPNGQYRKPTDPSRLKSLILDNFDFKFTPYREGLKKTIDWYVGS